MIRNLKGQVDWYGVWGLFLMAGSAAVFVWLMWTVIEVAL